jgi:alpha-D-xyloside xylohydrolase
VATTAPDRGSLSRRLVERATVSTLGERGVDLATVAHVDPWPTGPFPPPPDPSSAIGGRIHVEAVGERVLRIRYAEGDDVREGGEHMIVGAPDAASTVDVVAGDATVTIATGAFVAEVELDPYRIVIRTPDGRALTRIGGPDENYFRVGDSLGTGVSVDTADERPVATETFALAPDAAVYGLGEGFVGLDKRGQTLELRVSDAMGAHTPRVYKAVPFFVTTAGFGVFAHTSADVRAWVGSRSAAEVQLAVDDDLLDVFVFVGGLETVLGDYTSLTGRSPMPPDWSFGWWQSKSSYVSADETLAVVREMRDAGFPLDVIHLDTAWFATDWLCDLEFSPERFPDPEAYASEMRRNGVHLSLWQTPYLPAGTRLHDRLAGVDGFVRSSDGTPFDIGIHFVQGYDGPVHVVDWTNERAVNVMVDEYARLLRTGASVIKADFGEEAPNDGVYADGTPGSRMHNRYPLDYQAAVHRAALATNGEAIAWSRSGWAGAQRYPVHWGGDVPAAWDMMAPELAGGLSLGMSGFTFWSADIGGTGEPPDDAELAVRWLQWAILLSHARIHGAGDREPSRWAEPQRTIARSWLELRYRLLPYVLAAARDCAARGLPFARPLALAFGDDPTTWRIADEFLCGDGLLVAPLLEPGGRRRVYLPRGRWTDWWTRDVLEGPSWIEVEHPLETSPLFVREGAVVPLGPPMQHVGERPTDPLTLVVAPFSASGETRLALEVDGAAVEVTYSATDSEHVVRVSGARGRVELDALPGGDVSLEG